MKSRNCSVGQFAFGWFLVRQSILQTDCFLVKVDAAYAIPFLDGQGTTGSSKSPFVKTSFIFREEVKSHIRRKSLFTRVITAILHSALHGSIQCGFALIYMFVSFQKAAEIAKTQNQNKSNCQNLETVTSRAFEKSSSNERK